MSEPFSIKKAFDFTAGSLGKAVSIVLKGVLVILVLAGVLYAPYHYGYNKGWKDHAAKFPQTVITGGNTQINQRVEEKEPFFVLKVWFLKLHTIK